MPDTSPSERDLPGDQLTDMSNWRTPEIVTDLPDMASQMPSAREMSGDSVREIEPTSRLNRIARRAHQMYEARGGMHGCSVDDWLQAEREIDHTD